MATMTSVWKREAVGEETLSKRAYAGLICFWTALGIATSASAASVSLAWEPSLWLFLGALVTSIVGVSVAHVTRNPAVTLFGYALVVIPFGLMLGPVVHLYPAADIVKALAMTTGVVVGLGTFGAIYPRSLEGWGIWLFGGLLVLIIGQFGLIFAGSLGLNIQGAMSLWDWLGIALFSAYVIYDLNRAMRLQRTVNNTISVAVAVYLDFVNLFIRILNRK